MRVGNVKRALSARHRRRKEPYFMRRKLMAIDTDEGFDNTILDVCACVKHKRVKFYGEGWINLSPGEIADGFVVKFTMKFRFIPTKCDKC